MSAFLFLMPGTPADKEVARLWDDLGSADEVKVYLAGWNLALAPGDSVPWLRQRLQPVPVADSVQVARLVRELGHDRFPVRQKALRQLRTMGEGALVDLKLALAKKPSLEVRRRIEQLVEELSSEEPSPDLRRQLRAITALERAETPEARQLLKVLAGGAPGARLTRAAQAALQRLAARP
jgi:hypothetical protein